MATLLTQRPPKTMRQSLRTPDISQYLKSRGLRGFFMSKIKLPGPLNEASVWRTSIRSPRGRCS